MFRSIIVIIILYLNGRFLKGAEKDVSLSSSFLPLLLILLLSVAYETHA
jgi:hypothetical protein